MHNGLSLSFFFGGLERGSLHALKEQWTTHSLGGFYLTFWTEMPHSLSVCVCVYVSFFSLLAYWFDFDFDFDFSHPLFSPISAPPQLLSFPRAETPSQRAPDLAEDACLGSWR